MGWISIKYNLSYKADDHKIPVDLSHFAEKVWLNENDSSGYSGSTITGVNILLDTIYNYPAFQTYAIDYHTPYYEDLTIYEWLTKVKPTNTSYMFRNCLDIVPSYKLDLHFFDTSEVIDMQLMFRGCENLNAINLTNFNTSNVTSMESMFNRCANLRSLDLSSFDSSKVTSFRAMFMYCRSLSVLDISNFYIDSNADITNMFTNCNSLSYIIINSEEVKLTWLPLPSTNSCKILVPKVSINLYKAAFGSSYSIEPIEDYAITRNNGEIDVSLPESFTHTYNFVRTNANTTTGIPTITYTLSYHNAFNREDVTETKTITDNGLNVSLPTNSTYTLNINSRGYYGNASNYLTFTSNLNYSDTTTSNKTIDVYYNTLY